MKILTCFMILLTLSSVSEGAKGGAKSIMRGRKGQSGNAGSFAGYYGHGSYTGRDNNQDGGWDEYEEGSGGGMIMIVQDLGMTIQKIIPLHALDCV